MRKLAFVLLIALAPVSAANAQNMPLNQFLDRATALEKKGPLALMSSDLGRLKKEMQASGKALGAERRAAMKAGKPPAFCPPQKQAGFSPSEILGHFRAIPAAQRAQMTTRDGFRSLLAKRYPCG
jgi:hypothetical protein